MLEVQVPRFDFEEGHLIPSPWHYAIWGLLELGYGWMAQVLVESGEGWWN